MTQTKHPPDRLGRPQPYRRRRGRAPRRPSGARPADHRRRAAHGGARRHHREHRPAVDGRLLPQVADLDDLGAQRLHAGLRRPAAARRPVRRPARPAPHVHDRPGALLPRQLPRRHRPELPDAARRAHHPGPGRRDLLARPRCRWSPPSSRRARPAPGRSPSTPLSPVPAPRSACCSAASSPSTSPGGGCCSSTSRSASCW